MLGDKQAASLVKQALSTRAALAADYAEVAISVLDRQLTRFAHNQIHQNVGEHTLNLQIRVVSDRRQGVASTGDLSPTGIDRACRQALDLAEHLPQATEPIPLPEDRPPLISTAGFHEATAAASADRRANLVNDAVQVARSAGISAFGFVTNEVQERIVGNGRGLMCYHAGTTAEAKVTIMAGAAAGAATVAAGDIGALDLSALAEEATRRAAAGEPRRDVPPGTYPVVLDVYAVADLVRMLSAMGFSAQAMQEERSFLTGRLGQPIMAPTITISDDPTATGGLPTPFDWEGTPCQPVGIITDGMAQAVVHDLSTAAQAGTHSTGHALLPPNPLGPQATHLFVNAGDQSMADLVAGIRRGLFISHLWYTRIVHGRWAVVTGMTRDGTFWIEDGEIAYPIRDLRFTQSYADALRDAEAIGRETRLLRNNDFTLSVPAIRTAGFHFTGQTSP